MDKEAESIPRGRALDALAIIERVIYEERDLPTRYAGHGDGWPWTDHRLRSGAESPGHTEAERFEWAIRTWLRTVYRLELLEWPADGASPWLLVLRPWLASIVGWYAVLELGRAAGDSGYALLVAEMNRITVRL